MLSRAELREDTGWSTPTPKRFLLLADHIVDTDTLRLISTPAQTRLTPKSAAVLLHMAQAGGRTLSRTQLLDEVWKGTCPTPDVLTQAVTDLRRALGDDVQSPRYIETLPRRGYRLVAPVRFADTVDGGEPAAVPSPSLSPVHTPAAAMVTAAWPASAGLPAVSAAAPPNVETAAALPAAELQRRSWGALAIVVILAVALLGLTALYGMRFLAGGPAPRWAVASRWIVSADTGRHSFPTVSADGERVAYAIGDKGRGHIVERAVQPPSQARALTGSEDEEEFYPEWSPDGSSLAYNAYDADARCELMLHAADGAGARRLGPCPTEPPHFYSWSTDGRSLVASMDFAHTRRNFALGLIDVGSGKASAIDYAHGERDMDLEPRYSPDGSRIAFRRGANPYGDLYVMPAGGGQPVALTHLQTAIHGFDWTRDGSALVFSSRHEGQPALYTVSLDDGRIETLGVGPADFPRSARASDVVVYEIPRQRSQLQFIARDGEAGEEPADFLPSTGNDTQPSIAPGDDRTAFISDRAGAQQVWIHDPADDETFAVTRRMPLLLYAPNWRSDGQRLLVVDRSAGGGSAVEIDLATRGERVLTPQGLDVHYAAYAAGTDAYLVVAAVAPDDTQLIEFTRGQSADVQPRVLAHDVGRVEYDPASRRVYFAKSTRAGMFAVDEETGAESLVAAGFASHYRDGWRLAGGRIYYFGAAAAAGTGIHELDPQTGSDRIVATMSGEPTDLGFSVSHDRTRFVVAHLVEHDTHIGAIALRPAHPPGG